MSDTVFIGLLDDDLPGLVEPHDPVHLVNGGLLLPLRVDDACAAELGAVYSPGVKDEVLLAQEAGVVAAGLAPVALEYLQVQTSLILPSGNLMLIWPFWRSAEHMHHFESAGCDVSSHIRISCLHPLIEADQLFRRFLVSFEAGNACIDTSLIELQLFNSLLNIIREASDLIRDL